ncbi:MAG TPA: hypothetical protein VEH62_13965 [Gemmatimonadales bacterium]|nr:hypothetical protein [Gemmatimonadales bacterium]
MHALLVALRLLHIVLGVYWAGAIFFFVTFVQPSIRDAGPDGMKVAQQIIRRGYLSIVPGIAVLTMLAGLTLYWLDARALGDAWWSSGTGQAFSVGAAAAIVAFAIGMAVTRRSMLRAIALGQELPKLAEGPDRQARMAEIERLRGLATRGAQWVAALLLVAVAAMAVARYL